MLLNRSPVDGFGWHKSDLINMGVPARWSKLWQGSACDMNVRTRSSAIHLVSYNSDEFGYWIRKRIFPHPLKFLDDVAHVSLEISCFRVLRGPNLSFQILPGQYSGLDVRYAELFCLQTTRFCLSFFVPCSHCRSRTQ